jgi:hypothetical protein
MLLRTLYPDYSGVCAAACGYGSNWTCAGNVHWPAAKSSSVRFTYWVYDYYSSQAPVPGADVSVCTGCPCPAANTPVIAHAQTDANGFVTLEVPQYLSATGQAIGICIQTTAPGFLTNFLYAGLPLSEAAFSINDVLQPKTAWGIVLLTASAQQQAQATLAPYDPTRGLIGAGIWDCLAAPAPSAYVTINTTDPMVVPYLAVDAGSDAWPTGHRRPAGGPLGK